MEKTLTQSVLVKIETALRTADDDYAWSAYLTALRHALKAHAETYSRVTAASSISLMRQMRDYTPDQWDGWRDADVADLWCALQLYSRYD
jgi:hypothetical protein